MNKMRIGPEVPTPDACGSSVDHEADFLAGYSCQEYKPLKSEIRRPMDLEEAVGTLLQVIVRAGFAVAVFAWGTIALPQELQDKLCGLIGKRIGILHCSGYRVRCLDDQK